MLSSCPTKNSICWGISLQTNIAGFCLARVHETFKLVESKANTEKSRLQTQRLAWTSLWCFNQQFMYANVAHDALQWDVLHVIAMFLPCLILPIDSLCSCKIENVWASFTNAIWKLLQSRGSIFRKLKKSVCYQTF